MAADAVAFGCCMPLAGVRAFNAAGKVCGCESKFSEAYRYAREQHSLGAAVVVGRWASRVGSAVGFKEKEGDQVRGRYELIGAASQSTGISEAFRLGVANSLSLIGPDRTVVFVDQVLELALDPSVCASRPLRIRRPGPPPICEVPLAQVRSQLQYRLNVDEVLKKFPNVLRFDPIPVLCRGGVCSSIKRGRALCRGDDHLNGNGALKLSGSLLAAMTPKPPPPHEAPEK